MQLTVISGSHRPTGQTGKVARFIYERSQSMSAWSQSDVLDLAGNPLPLWDEGVWDGTPEWQDHLGPLREQLRESDAFVVVTPEWHGMVPAGLKNFFLMCSSKELGHKPALIVSVSAGAGGAYPVAELRMSSYKNNRLCYLPEHLIVRQVEQVFNSDSANNDPHSHDFLVRRLDYCLGLLARYSLALKEVRASGVADTDEFKNGM